MPAVNNLAGENVGAYGVGSAVGGGASMASSSTAPGRTPDGTQWAVALIVLGSLTFLVLLEVGGFKTIIASSITR